MHFAGPHCLPFAWIYCPKEIARRGVNEREADRILHSNPAEIYFPPPPPPPPRSEDTREFSNLNISISQFIPRGQTCVFPIVAAISRRRELKSEMIISDIRSLDFLSARSSNLPQLPNIITIFRIIKNNVVSPINECVKLEIVIYDVSKALLMTNV